MLVSGKVHFRAAAEMLDCAFHVRPLGGDTGEEGKFCLDMMLKVLWIELNLDVVERSSSAGQ